ncbi:hypothetical protein [Jiella sonneratiae]|uniref:Pyrrolidone-carboxylate peptidase n=1 Tax=Jiella sonneratiae TaxID=2816856 RepID=A0ABS3J4V3_9HYPH|nr:hypothetical protein [Jiella sonneratiae]MBO0904708.1 hypothetical protein [Jiella sonneratiae]
MSILLAGFGAFPGVARNPSQDLVERIADRLPPQAGAVVLPVSWDEAFQRLKAEILRLRPRSVLLFGAHLRAERFRVELVARNRRELGRPDALGAFPAGPSIGDGPETLACRLDWRAVAGALRRAGIDFEWSSNAGGYLCNDTLYRLALAADGLGVERFGFFHLPSSDEGVGDLVLQLPLPEVFMSVPMATLEAAALALLQSVGTAGTDVERPIAG